MQPYHALLHTHSTLLMKYFLFLIIGVSFFWELRFTGNDFASTYKTSLGSAMWGAALIYLYDFSMAMRGKNSAYMIEFHSRLKKDIMVCLAFGFSLLPVFMLLPTPYTFTNIDLACLGLPFLVSSLLDILVVKRLRVADMRLPRKIVFVLLSLPVITYAVFLYWLYEILSNRYSQSQALWMQITIFFTGIYALFAASFIRFVMEKQRLELSPALLDLFNSIKISPGLYANAAHVAEQWNKEVNLRKKEVRNTKQKRRKKRMKH